MCLSQYLYIPIKCINILVILIISDRLVFANACKDQLFVSGKTRRSVPGCWSTQAAKIPLSERSCCNSATWNMVQVCFKYQRCPAVPRRKFRKRAMIIGNLWCIGISVRCINNESLTLWGASTTEPNDCWDFHEMIEINNRKEPAHERFSEWEKNMTKWWRNDWLIDRLNKETEKTWRSGEGRIDGLIDWMNECKHACIDVWRNEGRNAWMNGWTKVERTNKRTKERTNEWMGAWTSEWLDYIVPKAFTLLNYNYNVLSQVNSKDYCMEPRILAYCILSRWLLYIFERFFFQRFAPIPYLLQRIPVLLKGSLLQECCPHTN